ncbi:LytTR family DNA-binding domain-containing protein [Simiduia agarivorans]|uniref:AlgR/AgrA/LytR family regulatory protein RpfD n=1 Tax=Simiduia agarivorans (strain DSM 21679 / JCM 13881 / BCRC 17597 / SA1) TaxID=1117647 RepID=R9S575_SIMAS|nr:LytTR family DNA-binding domain-containing protein [Simiduia agarivorans]AGN11375.1 AlgR/AgrA/LytR family regulatory protein RpfD [Simiduia agarivorans SA1 = DSM 21679]
MHRATKQGQMPERAWPVTNRVLPGTNAMTFDDYQRRPRVWQSLFWCVLVGLVILVNATTQLMEWQRAGTQLPVWAPFLWEVSSALAWTLLIYPMHRFDRRFPLQWGRLRRHGIYHLLFSLPVSLFHVGVMFGLRFLVYGLLEQDYNPGDWGWVLVYEYRKDILVYLLILSVFYTHDFVVSRLAGEAAFVQEGEEATPDRLSDRVLVKKFGREFVVQLQSVQWLAANGNYVNLHVGERVYPLRATMAQMEQRLEPMGFMRVHRSAIVNLRAIASLEPLENGEALIHLTEGQQVKCSRNYRDGLKERLR